MTTKKKIQREPFLFRLIYNLFGSDETQGVEIQEIANKKFYFFLVFVTIAMFILSTLVKVFIT